MKLIIHDSIPATAIGRRLKLLDVRIDSEPNETGVKIK
jgi:hypothetical protein